MHIFKGQEWGGGVDSEIRRLETYFCMNIMISMRGQFSSNISHRNCYYSRLERTTHRT